MSKLVKINLYEGHKVEPKHVMQMVATKKENSYSKYDSRKYQYSVSLFLDEEFIINYVVLENEWELLKSDIKAKVIEDLNYIMITSSHKMLISKNIVHSVAGRQSDWLDKFKNLKSKSIEAMLNVTGFIYIYAITPNAFCEGLKLITNDPFEGEHLFYDLPKEGFEEIII